MNKAFYATHKESWVLPQEEREIAESIANQWGMLGRTVIISEDTQAIKVESFSWTKYEREGKWTKKDN